MEVLEIKEGENTPLICFDTEKGSFLVSGRSFPENAKKFYLPILDWMKNISVSQNLNAEFRLYYISSSSIIALLEIIKVLDSYALKGVNVKIDWIYEEGDEDSMQIGEGYKEICNSEFNLISVS